MSDHPTAADYANAAAQHATDATRELAARVKRLEVEIEELKIWRIAVERTLS